MQFVRTTRTVLAVAALIAVSACSDGDSLPLDAVVPDPSASAAYLETVSRGLALALEDPAHRSYVVRTLQASGNPEHRVTLGALMAGEDGIALAGAIASHIGLTAADLIRRLESMPELDVYFPSTLDRIDWPTTREIVVLGSFAASREFAAADRTGFDTRGEPVLVKMEARNDFAVLLVRPSEPATRRPVEECHRTARHCGGETGGGSSTWGYTLPGVTWNACTTNPADDHDADGISNACEFSIAHAFRPVLMHHRFDGATTKEPYWTVRPDGHGAVQVMYLLSYHYDAGHHNTAVTQHYGDSEFIIFRIVNPNVSDTRWYLESATLSAHWGAPTDATYSGSAAFLEYPGISRGRPRIWVAQSKHANYKSRGDCNWGAFGMDSCVDNDIPEDLDVRSERNIGNTGYGGGQRLLDCVASAFGGVNRARIECFFTGDFFGGWITHATASQSAGPYRHPLRAYNFMSAGAGIPIDEPCDPYARHCG